MATLFTPSRYVAVDGSGLVYALAKLYFYTTGTTTLVTVYAASDLGSTLSNPVIADSNGLFPAIYLAPGTTYKAVLKDSSDNTVWTTDPIGSAALSYSSTGSSTAPRSYLAGLKLSNNGSTPNTKIDVAEGQCADSTNVVTMNLSAVTLDCGITGANGLDTGSLANSTWYHAFVIAKTDGTTATLASTSASGPTLPSGYTYKRRIGSFKTDGSAHILAFVQDGDDFWWSTPVMDISATNPGTSAVTRTLASVPTGVTVKACVHVILVNSGSGGATSAYVSSLDTTDMDPASTSPRIADTPAVETASGGTQGSGNRIYVKTNTSAQVRSRVSFSDGSVGFALTTLGWVDRRGRDS